MAWSRRMLLGTAAAVLALAQSGVAVAITDTSAAQASTAATAKVPGWRVVATAGSKAHPGLMEAVAAVSPADAYAFGALTSKASPDAYTSIIRHWNGRSWGAVFVPAGVTAALSGFPSTVATGSSASNVWAFTGAGAWIRFNGKHWSHGELPIEKPDDDGDITAAVAISPDDVWAVGADNTNVVLHYNGRSWTQQLMPAKLADPAYFQGIVALSPKSVWVTGDLDALTGSVIPGALHWNGRGWASVALKSPDPLINATADGHGGVWAVAQEPGSVKPFRPMLWHLSGGRWRSSHIVGSDPADFIDQFAAIPGSSSMWAVGVFRSGGLDLPAILLDGWVPH